ncbi:o-succinylbenzoate--CoA ligase [Cryobacterium algoritolerans]|uniref:O-succinylbenzoate--CoA ligase n=1 Tax=Cryobacterium algoritolerans TaxID=1259184 RepID=A0A4R8WX72_9MICO|nr:o-succinylbenzoate--CoA ligase [Cryobacterium algoritolerans]
MPRRVAVVIETSGSTSVPKRVMLGTDALLSSASAGAVALGGAGQWLLALPAHYIAGVQVLVRSIAAQTTPVVLPGGHFDLVGFLSGAERLAEPLRYTSLVPAQLARLVAAADDDRRLLAALRRFTGILVGGQAVPVGLLARAADLHLRVVRSYGSSETAGGCVYDGLPIGDTEVRAVDGQLEISGSVLAEGYLGDPDLTTERFGQARGVRWYRTGDLGDVDPASGLVRVLGRLDNVIISGGEKVSLDAVERVVRSLPGLAEAVAVAGDDDRWGQVPVVVVPFPADWPASSPATVGPEPLDRVRAATGAVLGPAARPARLVFVAAIPMLASGKPDRQELARLAGAAKK